MLDFDAGKLIIIGIVALIVIGPKELPRVMRQVGQAVAKMRRMAAEFRGQFMDALHEADLEDMKADAAKFAESAKIDAVIDPLAEIKAGITSALEAADKPAALPLDPVPAIAAPGDANASLNSVALPHLPEVPEKGAETYLAEGVAPAAPEPAAESASPGKAPAGTMATDAEMRVLAAALTVETGKTSPPRSETGGENAQDKV